MNQKKFKIGDIVKIKGKKHGLDLFYQYGQLHYRKFHVGELGRIILIDFDIIKIWVHHRNSNPHICRCMEDELIIANKDEYKKYEETDEKYEAKKIAERL